MKSSLSRPSGKSLIGFMKRAELKSHPGRFILRSTKTQEETFQRKGVSDIVGLWAVEEICQEQSST